MKPSLSRAASFLRLSACLALATIAFPCSARAENEGQNDLDKATQQKLGAQTTGELTEVVQLCESALKKGLDKSNTAFANDLLASALAQRGTIAAAKIFGDEGSPNARLNLDENWKTHRKDAQADLERAVKLTPNQPQAHYLLAKLNLLPEGNAEKAIESLDKAVTLSSDDPALRAKSLLLRSSLRKEVSQRIADLSDALKALPDNAALLRARGLALAEDQKWEAALADFDKSIAGDPNNAAVYQLKAAVLGKLDRLNDALAALEKAHTLSPKSIDLLATKAEIYRSQSNFKAAVEELTRALAIDGSNLTLLGLRADTYHRLGDKAKSLADVEKIVELKPDNLDLMRVRAGLLADLGQLDKAAEQLKKMHQANPKDALTTLDLGKLYVAMKQNEKAIAVFDEVLDKDPDNLDALRGRGDALLNLGRRREAIVTYEKAFERRSDDVGVLNNFAWVLATAPEEKLRDGQRAVVLATDACKRTEYKRDYILSTLAAAYAETGDFATARKWAAQAVEAASASKDEPDRKDELKKELESYKAEKPWRESLPADDPKPAEKKPEEKKTDAKKSGDDSQSKTAQDLPAAKK